MAVGVLSRGVIALLRRVATPARPLAECYFAGLSLRSRAPTTALFIGGVLVSVPCVAPFPVGMALSVFAG
jgi:hypothetical protein